MNNNENIKDSTIYRVVDYPGAPLCRYLVSEDGKIYDTLYKRFLKYHTDKDGYFRCTIPGATTRNVARITAYAFYPNERNLTLVVDHKDGNKQNNHYTNLEWVTVRENTLRAEKMGLRHVRGEYCNTNKYPESFIHELCRMMESGMDNMTIFRKVRNKENLDMKITEDKSMYMLIHHIRHKHIWPDVVSQYTYSPTSRSDKIFRPKEYSRFSEQDVHRICQLYISGLSLSDILLAFNITPQSSRFKKDTDMIRSIVSGRTWRYISERYFEPEIGESRRHKYDIDTIKLSNMIAANYPLNIIYSEFDVLNNDSKEDRLLIRAINRRIKNYHDMKKLHPGEDIFIKDEDIDNIENWAATW